VFFSQNTEGLAIRRRFHENEREHIQLKGSGRFEEMDSYMKLYVWTELKLYFLNFYSKSQTLDAYGEGASLMRQRTYT